jgi:hypothetical protein
MDTISILDLEFVVGGAGKSTASSSSAAPSFPAAITNTFNSVTSNPTFKTAIGTLGDAAAGCATGATKGIFGGPHAAVAGCALGAGASLIGDLAKNFGPMVMSAAKGAAHK